MSGCTLEAGLLTWGTAEVDVLGAGTAEVVLSSWLLVLEDSAGIGEVLPPTLEICAAILLASVAVGWLVADQAVLSWICWKRR